MEQYVTKNVDVKRVVSPNDTLLLESANNIVIDTDVDRIMIDGMRIRDYVHREIFGRAGAATSVVELETSSSAASGARTNFDAIYSGRGEFRTEETRCATLDASGSFIDGDCAHVITLEGANELRMNAKSIDNIYVGARTLREVIYALMNEYRLENSYAISSFEDVPVERASFGRESAHMGTAHTNTLVTYKITTNHTLIEGEQPDLVIRSAAGVQIDSPNFYLNNQLFREYIKQFLDERAFFTLTVDTSPGSVIPYVIKDFAVVEHGNIFDYEVRLFMYQEDITSEEVESGVGVHQDESSLHVINLNDFPYGDGKPHYKGNFESLTPGSVYNMYADLLNRRTMTLVPKVYVMGEILTVVLKGFSVSILNESYLKIVVDMYQEEGLEYGSNFKFNLLLNKSNVSDPPSDSYLFSSPPNKIYSDNTHLTQDAKSVPGGKETMNGVFIYDESNNQLRSGEFIEQPYLDSNADTRSKYVINFNSNQTFRLYTPLLEIFSPVLELDPMTVSSNYLTSNSYKDHFTTNLIQNDGPMQSNVSAFTEIRYDTDSSNYIITMNAVNLSNNWPRWPNEKYAETSNSIPKFDYIQFVCSASQNGREYFIGDVSNVIKYRIDFSNVVDNDMEIRIPYTAPLSDGAMSNTFSPFIANGNDNDTEFILQYQDIYGFFLAPRNTGANFLLRSLYSVTDTHSFVLGSSRTYTITITFNDDAREYSIDNILLRRTNAGGTQFTSDGGYGITPSNPHSNLAAIASNGDTKSFTVSISNIIPTETVNMGFQWTIYDNLNRSYIYTISTTENLTQPSGIVSITYKESPRIYNIVITDLKDAKDTIATTGSLTGFTATNVTSNASVMSNPSISGGVITNGVFRAVDTVSSRRYDIRGTFTDHYGFFKTIETDTTITPSFSNPTISMTSLRTYQIAITSGTLSSFRWKLSTVDESRAGFNTNTYTFLDTDTGIISCAAGILNDEGFNKPSSNYGSVSIPTSGYRTPSSITFDITGSSTFTASLRIGSTNYTYTNSWRPSELNIFSYRICGVLSNSATDIYTDSISTNFHNYKKFQLKLKTYNPEGFITSIDNGTKTFEPTNPQAVQSNELIISRSYAEATITLNNSGSYGSPPSIETTYSIKYGSNSGSYPFSINPFNIGDTLPDLSHSQTYHFKILKYVSGYGYTDVESEEFTFDTLVPTEPAAPLISNITVNITTEIIKVTFTSNYNGSPEESPTGYSLYQSNNQLSVNLSADYESGVEVDYQRRPVNADKIILKKLFGQNDYGYSNYSITQTLNFSAPSRTITIDTVTVFRNEYFTKFKFTTSHEPVAFRYLNPYNALNTIEYRDKSSLADWGLRIRSSKRYIARPLHATDYNIFWYFYKPGLNWYYVPPQSGTTYIFKESSLEYYFYSFVAQGVGRVPDTDIKLEVTFEESTTRNGNTDYIFNPIVEEPIYDIFSTFSTGPPDISWGYYDINSPGGVYPGVYSP